MSYTSPTLSELIKQGERRFQQRLPNLRRNTVISVLNRICAGLSASEHAHLEWLARQIIPTTADEDYLLEYCLYKGIVRKQATTASGSILVTTAGAATIPKNTEWQHSTTGLIYLTTEEVITTGAGDVLVPVQCEIEGVEGNLEEDESLSLTSPILGVQSTATVESITGGTDIETLSRLLSRLIYRVQFPPAGGAPHDYVRWATEVSGVTRAWCYPRYGGGGSVGVAFVMDDRTDILPTADDITRVRDYITSHRNIVTGQWEGMPANVELFVFAPKYQAVDFTIKVTPDSETLRKAVKQSLTAYLNNMEPGATLYLSQIRAAVSNTAGETDNTVVVPSSDIVMPKETIPVLGEVVWL